MPSTFLGLNTGLSGLNYFQAALNTTSHNISNSNTEGYSRQQVLASASNPVRQRQSYGMMGTGVTASKITQQRSNFYDSKYRAASAKQSQYEAEETNLLGLQTYMNEISGDSGYTKWLSNVSTSLQDIADNPEDYTTRIEYTLTADSFTDTMNELAANFQTQQKSINDEIELVVTEINSLSKQIFELSKQIISIELKGANANDLRDKRNVCIDKLSSYAAVDIEEVPLVFGAGKDAFQSEATSMTIRLNNHILVDDMEFNELMVSPREERINLNDVDGLVDIYWKNANGTPGESFKVYGSTGRLRGLFDIRDGNNAEGFVGKITGKTDNPASVTVECDTAIHVDKLNIPERGTITLNGKNYIYDGWEAEHDADGYLNNFTFKNLTMIVNDKTGKQVEVAAELPDGIEGYSAKMGDNNSVKGIPYYMARLNEMVRTFSKYMNNIINGREENPDGTITYKGVDEKGNPSLDMYTAKNPSGGDFKLKGTMDTAGTISSADVSYYRITALNWEVNSEWMDDPSKVVTSYIEDVEQGNVAHRPVIDKIIAGLQDTGMFSQGTAAHFMQAITTTMAVDIKKMEVFAANNDDVKYTIYNQRLSVSGVDENEEAADLTKFENLYNLASKVMSVMNEVYDKLINQTGL